MVWASPLAQSWLTRHCSSTPGPQKWKLCSQRASEAGLSGAGARQVETGQSPPDTLCVPLQKWQRRFFILYEHGLLRYALDEMVSVLLRPSPLLPRPSPGPFVAVVSALWQLCALASASAREAGDVEARVAAGCSSPHSPDLCLEAPSVATGESHGEGGSILLFRVVGAPG